MLASLTIKNVVLIEQLTINFNEGLCALTGETGAGKSILLDSLGLAMGNRSDAGLVRKGTEQASVTAVFDVVPSHPIYNFITEQDLEADGEIVLRRSVTSDGRSKAFINDQSVSAGLLKQVSQKLVEIHGQFDTQNLLNSQYHLSILDEYAGNEKFLIALKGKWSVWKTFEISLIEEREKIEKARLDEEFYRTSLEDLDALEPEEGEEGTLTNLRDRLMRREQILSSLGEAEKGIEDIDNITNTVWKSLEKLGDEGGNVVSAMERANAEIQEVVAGLQDLASEIENSEDSLQSVDDRLFALKAQARKHGCAIDDLSDKREEIASALNAIENQDGLMVDLMRKTQAAQKAFFEDAQKLSEKRKKISLKMADLIMKELAPLKLEKTKFTVHFDTLDEKNCNERGIDKVQFFVSTNPGAEPGPLNKIASGGEMSRLMLALKVVLSEVGSANALIFDEVDSGIGGATAAAVGERLAELSKTNQVLVITHSPQVAAIAKNHWIVSKQGVDKVTTNVIALSTAEQRQEEIARMLAGSEITAEARAAANKLLEASAA